MGVKGKSYRVGRADLCPPPSDASMIKRSFTTAALREDAVQPEVVLSTSSKLKSAHGSCSFITTARSRHPTDGQLPTRAKRSRAYPSEETSRLFSRISST